MKLELLAKSKICASVSGLDDKFLTHLALMSSGAEETGMKDAVVELLGLKDVLKVVEFGQPLLGIVYMYQPKLWLLLPLPFLLYWVATCSFLPQHIALSLLMLHNAYVSSLPHPIHEGMALIKGIPVQNTS